MHGGSLGLSMRLMLGQAGLTPGHQAETRRHSRAGMTVALNRARLTCTLLPACTWGPNLCTSTVGWFVAWLVQGTTVGFFSRLFSRLASKGVGCLGSSIIRLGLGLINALSVPPLARLLEALLPPVALILRQSSSSCLVGAKRKSCPPPSSSPPPPRACFARSELWPITAVRTR